MDINNPNYVDLTSKSRDNVLPYPPGYQRNVETFEESSRTNEKIKILTDKAFQLAISPASSIFMAFVLFYFLGSTLNIYTLIMLFTFISSQVKTLVNINKTFKDYESVPQLGFYKFIYFCMNLGIFCYSLSKLYNMGLLPLSPSDYVDLLPINGSQERITRIN